MSPEMEEERQSPKDHEYLLGRQTDVAADGRKEEALFSPRFKSVAALAGWDEETLLLASLIVDDTPDRQFKQKKRSDLSFKSPPSNSRSRKRRDQKRSPAPIQATILDLRDDQEENRTDSHGGKETDGTLNKDMTEKRESGGDNKAPESAPSSSGQGFALPSMDRLREELSCAICLEICFEPSTTACGHSFCRKCLESAAEKCGKRCPKCRQLISKARSCSVNTVLWNTIQLLFPDEVESRIAAKGETAAEKSECHLPEMERSDYNRRRSPRTSALLSRELHERRRAMPSQDEDAESQVPERGESHNNRRRSLRSVAVSSRDFRERRRRGAMPSQDEDAALALRLQREEFMEAFRETSENSRTSLSMARANLRAMASRALNIRIRNQAI